MYLANSSLTSFDTFFIAVNQATLKNVYQLMFFTGHIDIYYVKLKIHNQEFFLYLTKTCTVVLEILLRT